MLLSTSSMAPSVPIWYTMSSALRARQPLTIASDLDIEEFCTMRLAFLAVRQ